MNEKILCASNGLECKGVCRAAHLHRKRQRSEPKDTCPEAYGEGTVRGKKKISKKK